MFKFEFRPDIFIEYLPKMLYGLAGIFVVIAIIAFAIKLMHWVFPEKAKTGKHE